MTKQEVVEDLIERVTSLEVAVNMLMIKVAMMNPESVIPELTFTQKLQQAGIK